MSAGAPLRPGQLKDVEDTYTSLLTTAPVSTAKTEITRCSHRGQMENTEDANQAADMGRELAHSRQCLLCKNTSLNSIPRAYY